MHTFAHNGVDHSSAAAATGHSLPQIILVVLFVTVGVAIFMALLVYLANRFSAVKVPLIENDESDTEE